MPAHKHAHLMAEYAKDALETDRPWERWEVSHCGIWWTQLDDSPRWHEEYVYRRKPRTININGHEVPEPVREPLKDKQDYYITRLSHDRMYSLYAWESDCVDHYFLENGLIHLTQEAAIAHAKALLSFTKKD